MTDSESDNEALAAQVANYKLMASITASELETATNRSSAMQGDLERVQNSLEESCAINDELRKREETLRREHNEELMKQTRRVGAPAGGADQEAAPLSQGVGREV